MVKGYCVRVKAGARQEVSFIVWAIILLLLLLLFVVVVFLSDLKYFSLGLLAWFGSFGQHLG